MQFITFGWVRGTGLAPQPPPPVVVDKREWTVPSNGGFQAEDGVRQWSSLPGTGGLDEDVK